MRYITVGIGRGPRGFTGPGVPNGGTTGQRLAKASNANQDTTWTTDPTVRTTVRVGAGVPAGAPTGAELPLAYDTTAVTGGFYFWNTAAWVKVATIL